MTRTMITACGCAALLALLGAPARAAKPAACDALAEKFKQALDAAPGRCKRDRDCAAYPTFISCGGFTDRRSARKLHKIHKRYVAQGCGYSRVRCAKQAPQVPHCDKGQCKGKVEPCFALARGFNLALREPTPKCKVGGDCAAYPSGVVDCHGVTHKTTAAKLERFAAWFEKLGCKRISCPKSPRPLPICRGATGVCEAR